MLIVAVHYYTARPVNLVAFSLGVPISRKAILGGSDCNFFLDINKQT